MSKFADSESRSFVLLDGWDNLEQEEILEGPANGVI